MIIARVHDFDVRLNGSLPTFYKKNRGKENLKPFSASQFSLDSGHGLGTSSGLVNFEA